MESFTLGRRHHLDRAELSVYVVKQRRPFGFFWMICRMCFGRVSDARDMESFRLKDVLVRSRTSRLPVALDGEVEMMHPPLQYRSRPGALRVIVPRHDNSQKQPRAK
jgi:diacylglycerol kinase family enzyme